MELGSDGVRTNKFVEFRRRRRQAGEVEVDAAAEGGRVGLFGRLQAEAFQLGQYETVDRVADPGFVLHLG